MSYPACKISALEGFKVAACDLSAVYSKCFADLTADFENRIFANQGF